MRRRKVKKNLSKKIFKKTANRMNVRNETKIGFRGGYRI